MPPGHRVVVGRTRGDTVPVLSRWGDVGRVRQAGVTPTLSFDLRTGLTVTLLAGVACLVILSVGARPPAASSIVLLTVATVCALLALPVMSGRSRAEEDLALEWAAGGLPVACLALFLQLISFPAVVPGGGPLRTAGNDSALLYLIFHAWLYGCGLAGALRAPRKALRPTWIVGAGYALLAALSLAPAPALLTLHETYTPGLIVGEWVLVGLGVVTVVAWARICGRFPTPLRGWVGVALLLSTYELTFNALAGRRYDALWWASLTLQAAGFATLAVGGLLYLLQQSLRVEQFSAAALALRESELRGSEAVTGRLLVHSRELARSHTPEQVATTLCATVAALTGAQRVCVGHRDPPGRPGTALLAARDGEDVISVHDGLPTRSPAADADHRHADHRNTDRPGNHSFGVPPSLGETGQPVGGEAATRWSLPVTATRPVYLSSRAEIERKLLQAEWPPPDIVSMAVLPLRVGKLVIGTVAVQERRHRVWTSAERELLEGVADQCAPVLSRAQLAAREHQAAETLQRSLLPPRLPVVPGLVLTARYQPGREEQVGGDWYDGWALPDGRLALVIGDVVGKGLGAAVATGRLRASVRALAAADPSPARVLTQLDRLEADDSQDLVATVLYALFDADLRAVRMARAGHLPALVVHPDRRPVLLEDEGGTPIGLAAAPMPEHEVPLASGSTIVLYTDGLVEDRTRALQERLGDLLAAVYNQLRPGDPDSLATYLMTRFRTTYEDDVALIIASRAGTR
jgi:serine phosphatase RsbU (regulator of sigma subunit)